MTARLATVGLLAAALAGCGGGAQKRDDARVNGLEREVQQLKARLDATDKRVGALGLSEAVPLGAVTQTGPANTVVAECPPGAFLFRVPRTAPVGGEALCRPLSASIKAGPAPANSQ